MTPLVWTAAPRHAALHLVRACRALAACGALLGAACTASDRGAGVTRDGRVAVDAPAPDYAATTLAGDSVSLAALRGRKVVLLNVWATWCHPCRTEIPELQALHERYSARGLEIVGVSVDADGSDASVQEFMQEFRMTYPVWRDPDERVSTRFLVVGVPATFLIDREGVLRWRMTGPIRPNDSTLVRAIQRALGD